MQQPFVGIVSGSSIMGLYPQTRFPPQSSPGVDKHQANNDTAQ